MGHLRPHRPLRFSHPHEPTVYVRSRQMTVSRKGWVAKMAGPEQSVHKRTLSHIPSQCIFTFSWYHQRVMPDITKTEVADAPPFEPSDRPHLALISLVHPASGSVSLLHARHGTYSLDSNGNKTGPCLQKVHI